MLDGPIEQALKEHESIVSILNQSLDMVEKNFVQEIAKAVPLDKFKQGNLVDQEPGKTKEFGLLGEQLAVEKVEALVSHLKTLKEERIQIIKELSEKVGFLIVKITGLLL